MAAVELHLSDLEMEEEQEVHFVTHLDYILLLYQFYVGTQFKNQVVGIVCEIQFVYGAAVPATVVTVYRRGLDRPGALRAGPGVGAACGSGACPGGARRRRTPERTATGHRGTESRELP